MRRRGGDDKHGVCRRGGDDKHGVCRAKEGGSDLVLHSWTMLRSSAGSCTTTSHMPRNNAPAKLLAVKAHWQRKRKHSFVHDGQALRSNV